MWRSGRSAAFFKAGEPVFCAAHRGGIRPD
jgi:hypothetical protein